MKHQIRVIDRDGRLRHTVIEEPDRQEKQTAKELWGSQRDPSFPPPDSRDSLTVRFSPLICFSSYIILHSLTQPGVHVVAIVAHAPQFTSAGGTQQHLDVHTDVCCTQGAAPACLESTVVSPSGGSSHPAAVVGVRGAQGLHPSLLQLQHELYWFR